MVYSIFIDNHCRVSKTAQSQESRAWNEYRVTKPFYNISKGCLKHRQSGFRRPLRIVLRYNSQHLYPLFLKAQTMTRKILVTSALPYANGTPVMLAAQKQDKTERNLLKQYLKVTSLLKERTTKTE